MDDSTRTLAFTATTARGDVIEFRLPLHPHTSSRDHVGQLLERVLDRVSEVVEGPDDMSDGDVLQSLSLAMAVRLRVAGLSPEAARKRVADQSDIIDVTPEVPDAQSG